MVDRDDLNSHAAGDDDPQKPILRDVGVEEVWLRVRHYKFRVAVSFLLFFGFSVVWLHTTEPKYTARMVIAVYHEAVEDVIGRVKVPDPFLSDFLYQQLFTSTVLAERLEEKYHFFERVRDTCSGESDCVPNQAVAPKALVCRLAELVLENICAQRSGSENLAGFLQDHLRIAPMADSPFFEIKITHSNQELAIELLAAIYREVGELALEEVRQRIGARIQHLERILKTVGSAVGRRALGDQLLEVKQIMSQLDIRIAYVIDLIEEPTLSSRPTAPNPLVGLPLFLIAGLLLPGIVIVLVLLNTEKKR